MGNMWKVGDVEIRAVTDFDDQAWALSRLLPGCEPEMLDEEAYAPAATYDAAARILRLRFGGHVIKAGGRTILVDCGVGAGKVRPNRPEWDMRTDTAFLDSLHAQGFSPDDIDIVVITHAHVDHVGWLTVRGPDGGWVPTFPKAEHLFARAELEHWLAAYSTDSSTNFGSTADSIMPVVAHGNVRPVDDDHEITPEVTIRTYPGHTPGSAVVWVRSAGVSAAICGDLIHHPIQLRYPDLSTQFCGDKQLSAESRRDFLDEVVAQDAYLIPNHFRVAPMRIGKREDHYFPRTTL